VNEPSIYINVSEKTQIKNDLKNIFAESKVNEPSMHINVSEKTQIKNDLNDAKSIDQLNTFTEEKTDNEYLQSHAICVDMKQILSES